MNSEQNEQRTDETSTRSTIEGSNKSNNENNVKKKESTGSQNHQNENWKNSLQSTSTNNSTGNSSTNMNQFIFATYQSSSRENLDQNVHHIPHQNHHQSHTNLSSFPSMNETHLSVAANTNANVSALIDLPPSRETYKSRKKIYQLEKKKLAEQLLSTLNDPTVIVMADWLKVRTSVKAWVKIFCELRPGLLVIYKSAKVHKSGQWIGTVLLNICNVIERPSKKGGFCFKLFAQVAEQNIWAKQGPKGETYGAITLPLPPTYLMFRSASHVSGNRWIKAINLSFQCSKQMIRNDLHSSKDLKLNTELFNRLLDEEEINVTKDEHEIEREHFIDQDLTDDQNSSAEHEYNRSTDSDTTGSIENDYTSRHLKQHAKQHQSDEKLDKQTNSAAKKQQRINNKSGQNNETNQSSQLSSQCSQQDTRSRSIHLTSLKQSPASDSDQPDQTEYVYQPEDQRFGIDEHSQLEDAGVSEENKSLIWSILKNVRSSDLSKVVLPTFILEPRSFLEKLTDYYYHCDILASATNQNDPFERIKEVVKWYLSGMYKKPNGLKKPYNPILGEQFRCYWEHPDQASPDQLTKTFYVAEQISHHPPISAFHCVNRNQGYMVNGVVQVSSNYYGNSISAILNGNVRLNLINRGEDYLMNMPYAHCKGILFGGLTFELGGKVRISCERTNYSCDLEFKLKPFLGGEMNLIHGKIKLGTETIATIEGHWDKLINIKEKRTGKSSVLWQADQATFNRRLKRYVVPMHKQHEFESTNLWKKVSEAIMAGDQKIATVEKTILEDRQREEAKYRLENNIEYHPKLFELDPLTNQWHYKYEDVRPWDYRTDIIQFENQFVIQTLTKHRTVSKSSLTNFNASLSNCSVIELSPRLKGHNYSNAATLTPQKTSTRKRSPKVRAKCRDSKTLARKSDTSDNFFDKFDSIDGDEEEDTDYSSTNKTISNSKLLKKIEQNESELKQNFLNLQVRQQKLEQIVVEERQKLNRLATRSIFSNTNSQFFSSSNLITILILTVAIQLIIYKFTNHNHIRN